MESTANQASATRDTVGNRAAKPPQRVAMTNVDKAWLEMDSDVNLMIINGVMLFDEVIEYEQLRVILQERMVDRFDRFRQRIIESPPATGRMYWEEDPNFTLDAHLYQVDLPAPGNIAALQSFVGNQISEKLTNEKPLWRFYLIRNVEGGCAVFGRIHHCVGDGIALVQVLLSLTDPEGEQAEGGNRSLAGNSSAQVSTAKVEKNFSLPGSSLFNGALGILSPAWKIANRASQSALKLVKLAAHEGLQTVDNPMRLVEIGQAAGVLTAASAAILTKLLVLPPDRPSVFKGTLSPQKRVVWSNSLDLNVVKQIGKAMDATVNDVLVAGVAGALRRYLQARGDDVQSGDMRAMVPVNLRDPKKPLTLGNQFALVYLNLPVSVSDPTQRLLAVKRQMDVLKNSPEPMIVYQVLNFIGMLPGLVAEQATTWFSTKASAVLTNVPGPRQVLNFAGKPLRRILFWVPQSGQIGLGISIISYAGLVTLGIVADQALVPDPQPLIDSFDQEFAMLAQLIDDTVP